jgi:hypothetical protein
MSTQIKHSELLNHILHKPHKRSYKGLSKAEISEIKRQDAKKRGKELGNSNECIEYFNWFFNIQKKLNLNDDEFARLLGLKSSRQLFHYRANSGHYPSKLTRKRAVELDKLANLNKGIIIKKCKVKING